MAGLNGAAVAPDPPPAPTASLTRPGWRRKLTWMAAGVALISLGFYGGARLRGKPADAPVIRFSIPPPEGFQFGGLPAPSVSPDGRRIVFITTSKAGYQAWLRSLELPDVVPLVGAEGASFPFWSPDSNSIGFFTVEGKLKRIDFNGPAGPGRPRTLCDATNVDGGTWGVTGTILFSSHNGVLFRVADTGGAAVAIAGGSGMRYRYPWFLPDGRHFLFAGSLTRAQAAPRFGIRAGSIDSTETRQVAEADSNAIFVGGRLLYIRDSKLVSQRFDPERLAASGAAAPVAESMTAYAGYGNFSASAQGPLLYFGGAQPSLDLTWFDRDGTRETTLGSPFEPGLILSHPNLSPDGKRLAMDRVDGNNSDIWIYDVARGSRERFTFDAAKEIAPIWSPDGETILFASSRRGRFDLCRKPARGGGAEELLFADADDKFPRSISPDGRFLLFDRHSDKEPQQSIWVLPLAPAGKPFPLLETPKDESSGEFSPDGRWVAYESTESGRFGIYVAPFSGSGPAEVARQVSPEHVGSEFPRFPRWSKDGKQLFYSLLQKLMTVPVEVRAGAIEVGKEQKILDAGASILGYDVTRDGRKFIVKLRSREAALRPLTVVENWR